MHHAAAFFVLGTPIVALPAPATAPSPTLSPNQVVEAQLMALKRNDRPQKDSGIAIAFRFASPANKEATGPLPRFMAIVRGQAYAPMIDHAEAALGDAEVRADRAAVPVLVTAQDGRRWGYLFILGKQEGGRYDGCWMTDGVQLMGEAPRAGSGDGIAL